MPTATSVTDARGVIDELYLLSAVPLADYVDYVKRHTVNGMDVEEGSLIDFWRNAANNFQDRQLREEGIVDKAELLELPASMNAFRDTVMRDRRFEQTYSSLPISFGMVELDTLVVYQPGIRLNHVANILASLVRPVSEKVLFDLCFPIDRPTPDVHVSRSAGRRYVFRSSAVDMRFLGARLMGREMSAALPAEGAVVEAIGLLVGFGSSYLNVVRHGTRTVLNNGYHRAYALRSMGISHIPCVIQGVANSQELEFAGASELVRDYDALFASKRPPLFKDFFDSSLTTTLRTPPTRKQIQISFEIDTLTVPE